MLFSVVIPVYNVEKYLSECLDSFVHQTFSDFELVLVDDGSTDDSGNICDAYAKQYSFVKVVHQENAGLSCARNAGVPCTEGEYIVFLDSDDYIADKHFFEKLSESCKKKTDVILYGYQKYFESSQSFGSPVCQFPKVIGIQEPSEVIKRLLQADMYDGTAWGKAIKASLLKEHHIQFVPNMISEDSDWFLQVVSKAQTYDCVNEAFVVYRQREGSISHAPKVKSLTDNIQMLQKWWKIIENTSMSDSMREALFSVLARYYGNILILYTLFKEADVHEYYLEMKQLHFLLRYSVTKRSQIIRFVSKVLGLRMTIALIRVVGRFRTRM